jgi:hypothetical protein
MVNTLIASVFVSAMLAGGPCEYRDAPVGSEGGGAPTSTTLRPDAGTDPTGTRIPERPAMPAVPGSGLDTPPRRPPGAEH